MKRLRRSFRFIREASLAFIRKTAFGQHQLPPLGSMTLDLDDVELARKLLMSHQNWNDDSAVRRFELAFAEWNGSSDAFAFMSGRAAMSACLSALELQPEDEVIIPGFTCVVVPNAVEFAGLKVVYADIELDTYGLDVSSVSKLITPRTRVIVLQHLFGLVSRDYEAIVDIAAQNGIFVVEDCAHSTGASLNGIKVGNRGHLAFYSSEQSKVFNTIAGGIAVTNDSTLAEKLASIQACAPRPEDDRIKQILEHVCLNYVRNKHPQRWWKAEWDAIWLDSEPIVSTTKEEELGIKPRDYGQRMPGPIALLGLLQLEKIDAYNRIRRSAAARWDTWCDATGHRKPTVVSGSIPVFLRYPVLVAPELKEDLAWAEHKLGVRPGVWFLSHRHPVAGAVPNCPMATEAIARCVNFPTLQEERDAN